ncbi:hypothetical protein G9A89_022191 [Geosiphon pyriformis]|nr:hypothetical protein G9A89_022191 [Geosiphon pyriformis]
MSRNPWWLSFTLDSTTTTTATATTTTTATNMSADPKDSRVEKNTTETIKSQNTNRAPNRGFEENNKSPNQPEKVEEKTNNTTKSLPIPINETASDTSETPSIASTLVEQEISASPAIPIPTQQSTNVRTHDDTKRFSTSIRNWWYYNPTNATTTGNSSVTTTSNNVKTQTSNSLPVIDTNGHKNPDLPQTTAINSAPTTATAISDIFDKKPSNEQNQPINNSKKINNLTLNTDDQQKLPTHSDSPQLPSIETNLTSSSTVKTIVVAESTKNPDVKLSSSSSSRNSWWKFGTVSVATHSVKGINQSLGSTEIYSANELYTKAVTEVITMEPENMSLTHQKRTGASDTIDGKENIKGQSMIPIDEPGSSNNISVERDFLSDSTDGAQHKINSSSSSIRSVKKRKSSEIKRWSLFGPWSASNPNLLEPTTEEPENNNNASSSSTSFITTSDPSQSESISSALVPNPSQTLSTTPSRSSSITSKNDVPQLENFETDSLSSSSPHIKKNEPNPLVEALPKSRNTWLYFFSNVSKPQSHLAHVDKKLITDCIEQNQQQQQQQAPEMSEIGKQPIIIDVIKPPLVDGPSNALENKPDNLPLSSAKTPIKPGASLNKVLPTFEELSIFRSNKRPTSIVQQTLHVINSYFFPPDKAPESGLPKLLDELTRSSIDVKRIAIIGVHGWYPKKFVRAMSEIGKQPIIIDVIKPPLVDGPSNALENKPDNLPLSSAKTPIKPGASLNKVLPTFEELSIFRSNKRPTSIVQQTLHVINSYFFPPDKAPESGLPKLLDELTRSSIDVKRIAIIGVHGWYPKKFVRAVVGPPSGTSTKFCDMMSKAVAGYLAQYGINLPSDAITEIPLEGEGKINDRVNLSFRNLMANPTWYKALTSADVIFVATHSQGTPVSTMLLARLIQMNHINPRRQRISLLAMAGISHGPFPYLSFVKYFEPDAARELFEFGNSDSYLGTKYRDALKTLTDSGAKVVYVASMDDQVVPLYSGVFTGANHPSILRAVYIDSPIYRENDFLSNLIVFAVRLRNAGIQDHDLLVYLSEVITGPLTGEGHSTLYEESNVYNLAVRYLFESSPAGGKLLQKQFQAKKSYNPYYLPWAMRGILDDKSVEGSEYFGRELNKLRKQYEEWEPTSKAMKDVKFRLEPLRDAIGRAKL